MSVRNLNWYNLQATRQYPLDDSATGETDDHVAMPNNLLADAHIRFPANLGAHAYVQGFTSAPGIVTFLIGVSPSLEAEGTTIAAVRVIRPANPYVHYTITSLVDGVAGWVVLGPGIDEMFSGRFSSPRQTLISARCARAYKPLPIPSIGKLGLNSSLQGVVTLIGESPVEAVFLPSVTVAGKTSPAVVLKLSQADASISYNPFTYFSGTCSQRPESGTCPKTPIETINGVSPDCHGNINIDLGAPLVSVPFQNCGGFDVISPTTLQQACTSTNTRRESFKDLCCPEEVASLTELYNIPAAQYVPNKIIQVNSDPVTYYKAVSLTGTTINWVATTQVDAVCGWPDPTEAVPSPIATIQVLEDYPCLVLPVCADFCSCGSPPPLFDIKRGTFNMEATLAPFGCVPCGGQTSAPTTIEGQRQQTGRNTYATTSSASTNIAILKNCATDWAYNKNIGTQLKISSNGLDRNGGMVINYFYDNTTTNTQIKYLAAVLDVSRGQLRLLRYVNDSFVAEGAVDFPVLTNTWYDMTVTPMFTGSNIVIKIKVHELEPAARTVELNVPLTIEKYGPPTGAYGLFSSRSWTYFNRFTISG